MTKYGYPLEEDLRLKREVAEKKQGKMLPGNPDYYTHKNPHWYGKAQTYWTKEEVLRLNRLKRLKLETEKHIGSKKQWVEEAAKDALKQLPIFDQKRLDHFA